jgi:selenocysteine-specific elongation factor
MIVGTAGHVDHGKSALVRALTGVDPDRLAEEKRRGITLDLGFAYMPGPDDRVIGFVDVPGHENFIHNMLAGVTGIDFVLLTVAADDGIMPQTREHVAILDLLGVARGVVALTKSDMVSPARRVEVTAALQALLAPTALAGNGIVETSTVTDAGIETLRDMLLSAAKNTPARTEKDRLFRLAIDRCFTLRGVGTVVTGTALSGQITVGDTVMVSPPGLAARVRSIHAQNQPAERGIVGQRCALNLAGDSIAKDAIARGDMVIDPTLHAPTARIDVRLRLLASESEPVRVWLPVRLHNGATEVGARLVPLGAEPLRPGEEGWAQLVLERPIAAAAGDRFVLRDTSARRTIGGGRFVDLRAPARRRRTPERLARLAAMALPDPDSALAALLELRPFYLDLDAFRRDRALGPSFSAPADAISLTVRGPRHVFSAKRWADLAGAIHRALAEFHQTHADEKGAPPETLRRAVEPRLPAAVFAAALGELAARQELVLTGGLALLSEHATRWNPAQEALWDKITPLLSGDERFRPPRLGEIATRLAAPESTIRDLMKRAARLGLIEEVAPDHFFLRSAVAETAAIVRALAQASSDGQFGAAQLRDRLDTGRKNAIELLEYFDRRGVTMRRGDLRRIDARKLETLQAPSGKP